MPGTAVDRSSSISRRAWAWNIADLRVALDHHRYGREHENRDRDAPVARDDRQAVQHVVVIGAVRGRWAAGPRGTRGCRCRIRGR